MKMRKMLLLLLCGWLLAACNPDLATREMESTTTAVSTNIPDVNEVPSGKV